MYRCHSMVRVLTTISSSISSEQQTATNTHTQRQPFNIKTKFSYFASVTICWVLSQLPHPVIRPAGQRVNAWIVERLELSFHAHVSACILHSFFSEMKATWAFLAAEWSQRAWPSTRILFRKHKRLQLLRTATAWPIDQQHIAARDKAKHSEGPNARLSITSTTTTDERSMGRNTNTTNGRWVG